MKNSTAMALSTILFLVLSASACGSAPATEDASAAPDESEAAGEAAEGSSAEAADIPAPRPSRRTANRTSSTR